MTTTKIAIVMSDRAPLSIVESAWPQVASGEDFLGQYDFQSFDGARIVVRRHADGRTLVSGYAGDWDGGGRPTRRDVRAGFLLSAGDDVVRAIRRVQGILAGCEYAGDCAVGAAENCIADLPAEDID